MRYLEMRFFLFVIFFFLGQRWSSPVVSYAFYLYKLRISYFYFVSFSYFIGGSLPGVGFASAIPSFSRSFRPPPKRGVFVIAAMIGFGFDGVFFSPPFLF